jgi:hypothetical protein
LQLLVGLDDGRLATTLIGPCFGRHDFARSTEFDGFVVVVRRGAPCTSAQGKEAAALAVRGSGLPERERSVQRTLWRSQRRGRCRVPWRSLNPRPGAAKRGEEENGERCRASRRSSSVATVLLDGALARPKCSYRHRATFALVGGGMQVRIA